MRKIYSSKVVLNLYSVYKDNIVFGVSRFKILYAYFDNYTLLTSVEMRFLMIL